MNSECISIGYDVINFEINFVFLIKPFFLQSQDKNLNILRAKRSYDKISIFHHFYRAFIELDKTNFFGRSEPDFKTRMTKLINCSEVLDLRNTKLILAIHHVVLLIHTDC